MNVRLPDVYVIVADCLRADSFPVAKGSPSSRWPRGGEFIRFPRTVSSSSWTLPAHVSILSGLSPEQHGVHRLGGPRVSRDLPWLPAQLQAVGYRTFLVSANHNLNPDVGIDRGFDELAWGRWGENAFRLSTSHSPPYSSSQLPARDLWKDSILLGEQRRFGRAAGRAVANLPRFPWLLDIAARVARRVLLPEDTNFEVTPWIEPTFERLVTRSESTAPVFGFVNLMDCHEPYLPSLLGPGTVRAWLRVGRIRQDRTNWTYSAWPYTSQQLEVLRSLYARQAVRVAGRIGRLLESLERLGRLDHSLVVVTSDHGQALGENRRLFHSGGLSEPEVRVPLWVRLPEGRQCDARVSEWRSLIDIYPTIAAELQLPLDPRQFGLPLDAPTSSGRPVPPVAVADGIYTPEHYSSVGANCRWSASVAAYEQELKVVVDSTQPRPLVYDIDADPQERRDLSAISDPRAGRLAERAWRVLQLMKGAAPGDSSNSEVERRLGSWGYLT